MTVERLIQATEPRHEKLHVPPLSYLPRLRLPPISSPLRTPPARIAPPPASPRAKAGSLPDHGLVGRELEAQTSRIRRIQSRRGRSQFPHDWKVVGAGGEGELERFGADSKGMNGGRRELPYLIRFFSSFDPSLSGFLFLSRLRNCMSPNAFALRSQPLPLTHSSVLLLLL